MSGFGDGDRPARGDESLLVPATASSPDPRGSLAGVMASMQQRLDDLPAARASRRYFLATYLRTTEAVDGALVAGVFQDSQWVADWDLAFAGLYLAALDADLSDAPGVTRPWRLAFAASASLPPLRHVLLGINAHINFDLPQALLAVIPDSEFADPVTMALRRDDHERVDGILSGRVGAEDRILAGHSARSLLDRALRPLNRAASQRFLHEARAKVWQNTMELQRARLIGPQAYRERLGELEVLSAARIADLLAPGQVLLRLAVAGFGVLLPPAN